MSVPKLEVSDIQATILRPRPSPYKGQYVILRIDDADGYKGFDPKYFSKHLIVSEFFYASYPEATCRDVKKALRVRNAFEHLLDEAQS